MKLPIIIGALVMFLLSVGTAAFIWRRSVQPPVAADPESSMQADLEMKTWDDAAGFTFEYPEDLVVDKHDEDLQNYAHVEFTHTDHPGKIIVWAKDLPLNKRGVEVADTAEWVNNDSQYSGANILDTTLGGQPAKKILADSGQTIGAVYDGDLWYVESTLTDKDYWTHVFDSVVKSFSFKPPEGEEGTEAVYQTPVDEEEVLE